MTETLATEAVLSDDAQTLHNLGYAQELLRGMSGFSSYALSLSMICILAGGITSFHLGLSSVGGAVIGLGWPLSCLLSLAVAATMAHLSSAFPTAGGLYHWSSILGGKGWGWATAWLNLAGFVTVLAAINVGNYLFLMGSLAPILGFHPETLSASAGVVLQVTVVGAITVSQALFNHLGIKVTTRMTDFSGWWILLVAVALIVTLLVAAPSHDWSRLWTFANYSGLPAAAPVWPQTDNLWWLFALGLILPAYTITGFDAPAHAAEETVNATVNVPKAIVRSVLISGAFGWVMLVAMVIALPDMAAAAAQGPNAFFWLMESILPEWLRVVFFVSIGIAQYLCGLATVTAASRMAYAFARDGGMPFSNALKQVSTKFRTPAVAIWVTSLLAIAFTVYTPVYSTITTVCVSFMYLSYGMPTLVGFFKYRRSWTTMGPWSLGNWYRPLAAVTVAAVGFIILIGVQPPNDKALWILLGTFAVMVAFWYGFERRRFEGPPQGLAIQQRQQTILDIERRMTSDLDPDAAPAG